MLKNRLKKKKKNRKESGVKQIYPFGNMFPAFLLIDTMTYTQRTFTVKNLKTQAVDNLFINQENPSWIVQPFYSTLFCKDYSQFFVPILAKSKVTTCLTTMLFSIYYSRRTSLSHFVDIASFSSETIFIIHNSLFFQS